MNIDFGNIILLAPVLYLLVGAIIVLLVGLWAERRPGVGVDHYLPTQYLAPALVVPAFLALAGLACLGLGDNKIFLVSGMPTLVVDRFSALYGAVMLAALFFVMVLSLNYFGENQRHKAEYYSLMMLSSCGAVLMCMATELITLYLATELLGLLCYALTAFDKSNRRSAEGGLKYFLYGSCASAVMLYGMSLVFGAAGGTTFYDALAKSYAAADGFGGAGFVGMFLILAGFLFKLAAVPMHFWAPDAYEGAPAPVTSFLSVVSKAAGLGAITRFLMWVIYPTNSAHTPWYWVLVVCCVLSMFYGNLTALWQTSIKRMLAYSSIAQVGYMMIGILADMHAGSGMWGIRGLTLYVAAYAIMNTGAFAVVTALAKGVGSDKIEDFKGMIKRCPVCAVTLTVFLLSLAGIPPTAGFFAKFMVFGAAVKAGAAWEMATLAILGVINSVISVYYYFNVIRVMFTGTDEEKAIEISRGMVVTVTVLAAAAVLFIVFASPILSAAGNAAMGFIN